MARPTSKDELIAASARGYGKLTEFAASMTEGELVDGKLEVVPFSKAAKLAQRETPRGS